MSANRRYEVTTGMSRHFLYNMVFNPTNLHFLQKIIIFVTNVNIHIDMAINIKLAALMAKKHISLTELAEKIGITQANLSILKTGKGRAIRFSTLEAICKVLKCQPGDILEFER